MINFRFHLVSLIAVFLALALGVVMGATVIDQAIVDGLNSRIDSVENEADRQRAENSDLRDELDRRNAYVEATAAFTVSGRLEGVPVVVVALDGADGDNVRNVVAILQEAGAQVPGVLWIEQSWLLSDEDSAQRLADALGVLPEPDAERAAGWAALAERLATGTVPETTDVLTTLTDAGFVRFEAVGDDEEDSGSFPPGYPGSGARVLLIGGTDGSAESEAMMEFLAPVARALVAVDLRVVAGEAFRQEEDGPEQGARLTVVRGDDELAAVVSTVDDLEQMEGAVAAALALVDLGQGVVGHYGYGDGASGPIPETAST